MRTIVRAIVRLVLRPLVVRLVVRALVRLGLVRLALAAILVAIAAAAILVAIAVATIVAAAQDLGADDAIVLGARDVLGAERGRQQRAGVLVDLVDFLVAGGRFVEELAIVARGAGGGGFGRQLVGDRRQRLAFGRRARLGAGRLVGVVAFVRFVGTAGGGIGRRRVGPAFATATSASTATAATALLARRCAGFTRRRCFGGAAFARLHFACACLGACFVRGRFAVAAFRVGLVGCGSDRLVGARPVLAATPAPAPTTTLLRLAAALLRLRCRRAVRRRAVGRIGPRRIGMQPERVALQLHQVRMAPLPVERVFEALLHRRLGIAPDDGQQVELDRELGEAAGRQRLALALEDLDGGFDKSHGCGSLA
jgi:hypothetical protein